MEIVIIVVNRSAKFFHTASILVVVTKVRSFAVDKFSVPQDLGVAIKHCWYNVITEEP